MPEQEITLGPREHIGERVVEQAIRAPAFPCPRRSGPSRGLRHPA